MPSGTGSGRNFLLDMRDKDDADRDHSGVLTNTRNTGSSLPVVLYCANGSTVSTDIHFDFARMTAGIPHDWGVGFEINPITGTKYVLTTYNGAVVYRAIAATLNLSTAIFPQFISSSGAGTNEMQIYTRGARLRCWRYT